eukprot:2876808-Amphidinium_carterae.1
MNFGVCCLWHNPQNTRQNSSRTSFQSFWASLLLRTLALARLPLLLAGVALRDEAEARIVARECVAQRKQAVQDDVTLSILPHGSTLWKELQAFAENNPLSDCPCLLRTNELSVERLHKIATVEGQHAPNHSAVLISTALRSAELQAPHQTWSLRKFSEKCKAVKNAKQIITEFGLSQHPSLVALRDDNFLKDQFTLQLVFFSSAIHTQGCLLQFTSSHPNAERHLERAKVDEYFAMPASLSGLLPLLHEFLLSEPLQQGTGGRVETSTADHAVQEDDMMEVASLIVRRPPAAKVHAFQVVHLHPSSQKNSSLARHLLSGEQVAVATFTLAQQGVDEETIALRSSVSHALADSVALVTAQHFMELGEDKIKKRFCRMYLDSKVAFEWRDVQLPDYARQKAATTLLTQFVLADAYPGPYSVLLVRNTSDDRSIVDAWETAGLARTRGTCACQLTEAGRRLRTTLPSISALRSPSLFGIHPRW